MTKATTKPRRVLRLSLNNCTQCPFHQVQSDPDPGDWFNDDDVKVMCLRNQRTVTVSCRPYNVRKECAIPAWCPLPKEKRNG